MKKPPRWLATVSLSVFFHAVVVVGGLALLYREAPLPALLIDLEEILALSEDGRGAGSPATGGDGSRRAKNASGPDATPRAPAPPAGRSSSAPHSPRLHSEEPRKNAPASSETPPRTEGSASNESPPTRPPAATQERSEARDAPPAVTPTPVPPSPPPVAAPSPALMPSSPSASTSSGGGAGAGSSSVAGGTTRQGGDVPSGMGGGSGAGAGTNDLGAGGAGRAGQMSAAVAPGTGGGLGLGDGSGTEYAEYLARVRQRIQDSLRYPPSARRRGVTGTVHLEIAIGPDGAIAAVSVDTSSSHDVLDRAAVDAARSAPRVPFPKDVRATPLRVRLPVRFELQ